MTSSDDYAVHFGGPAHPPRRLSSLLAERIEAVPPGGEIHWITYYLRDRELANALLRAQRRGVHVSLTVDGRPRTPRANHAVLGMLGGADGLGQGLRVVAHGIPFKGIWHPHLHEKLYCFSHPQPTALVGSFNPSGTEDETEPDIIAEIGDQDRGHNFLVELRDATVVAALVEHARQMHTARHTFLERFGQAANGAVQSRDLTLYFWPRSQPNPIFRALFARPEHSIVRIAASHIKGPTAVWTLARLVRRGARVAILTEETHRRVPPSAIRRLRNAGVDVGRVVHRDGVPMHDKFMLVEGADGSRWVAFGSLNWTERSLRLNHEIAAISTHPHLIEAFEGRWQALAAHADLSTRKMCGDTDRARTPSKRPS